jgi:pilus assembly protein TadC
MTSIVLAGAASALAVFAIIVKARARKPKKAEKLEKAEIVKRLLALSERESIVWASPPTVRPRLPRSVQGARPSTIHQRPTEITSRPIRTHEQA